jgi:hypothetical protein
MANVLVLISGVLGDGFAKTFVDDVVHVPSAPAPMDFQESCFRLLRFISLTDVNFIHEKKISFGPNGREADDCQSGASTSRTQQ